MQPSAETTDEEEETDDEPYNSNATNIVTCVALKGVKRGLPAVCLPACLPSIFMCIILI